MERVFSAARDVPDMPPRSFAALLVLVVLVAAPAAGLGVTTQAGAPAGDAPDAAVGGSGSSATVALAQDTSPPVALAQQATATAGPPTGTAGTPGGTDTPSGGVTGTPSSTATPTPADRGALPPSEETWRLQLEPDGDARWRVSVTVPIRNAEDAAAFDEVASDFGTVENPLDYEFFRRAAAEASAETGREMAIEDVSRSTSRVNGTGTLNVSFTWTNFARTTGDRLVVGDGFNTTRGTWLPSLHDRLTLVVVPPSGYGVTSAPQVGIVDGAARWEGPYDFGGREPWIVYSGSAPTPTPADPSVTSTPGAGTDGTDTPGGPLGSLLPVAALAVVAGASAAVLVVYMRREDGGDGAVGGVSGDGSGDGGAAAGSASATDGTTAVDDSGSAAGGSVTTGSTDEATNGESGGATGGAAGGAAAGAAGADGADADDGGDEQDDGIDEELLSDEERVERLLERNGGRMKQATIVKETGWSNAKVSQLLSAMAEEGRVDKLRIGRENLISFPDEDVTDIDSSSE
jgi:hypothetical protein